MEYIEAFTHDSHTTYEAVFQIDNSRTISVIIPDEPWLDPTLRKALKEATE